MPHLLVYGVELVLAVEVEIPSLRILMETKLEEVEWAHSRYNQLNFIKEKRLIAFCPGECYKKRKVRAYEKKIKHRSFREGDLVPKKILPFKEDPWGMFKPNSEELDVITKVL